MQKLSGKTMDMLPEVVGFFTGIPTKLSLHFFDFPMILYAFYKIQQKGNTI
jgi:hypothetical protein